MGKVGTLVNFRRRRIFFEDLVTNPFQNEYFYAKTWWKSSKFSRCRAKNTVRTFFIQYCSCYNTKAIFFIIRAEGAKIFGIFTFKWNFRGRQQQPFILKWNSQLSGISSTIFMHSQLSGIPLKCESSVARCFMLLDPQLLLTSEIQSGSWENRLKKFKKYVKSANSKAFPLYSM